jgi:hypothetical protein
MEKGTKGTTRKKAGEGIEAGVEKGGESREETRVKAGFEQLVNVRRGR